MVQILKKANKYSNFITESIRRKNYIVKNPVYLPHNSGINIRILYAESIPPHMW